MAALVWGAWGELWQLDERVDFNGSQKLIRVHPGVTTLDIGPHVYSAWKRWVMLQDNSKFPPAMRSVGSDPIPGGVTGNTFFLTNGWKLMYDPSVVGVKGTLFSDDYDTAYYLENGKPVYAAQVSALVNTAVTYQNVVTGDVSQVATQVWQAPERALSPAAEQRMAEKVWTTPTDIVLQPGTFGHTFVKKLLTVAKFLGLK